MSIDQQPSYVWVDKKENELVANENNLDQLVQKAIDEKTDFISSDVYWNIEEINEKFNATVDTWYRDFKWDINISDKERVQWALSDIAWKFNIALEEYIGDKKATDQQLMANLNGISSNLADIVAPYSDKVADKAERMKTAERTINWMKKAWPLVSNVETQAGRAERGG